MSVIYVLMRWWTVVLCVPEEPAVKSKRDKTDLFRRATSFKLASAVK